MVALVPAQADLERLALEGAEGAEPVEDLHLTLAFLGDAANWTPGDRGSLLQGLASLPRIAVVADGFGANYWNPGSDSPSWNLAVGGSELEVAHGAVWELLYNAVNDMAAPEIPEQHAPWQPHICLAYTEDVTLAAQVAERVGPVAFDRLRVAFGEDVTDFPLTAATLPEREFDRGDDMTAAATEPAVVEEGAWEGVLVIEGSPTGDGRQFSSGALTWAELPLPLKWQEREAEGHSGAVIVGRIDAIEREGNQLVGRGVFDLEGEHGREAHRLVNGRFLRGASIMPDDISDSDVELVFADGQDEGNPFARPELTIYNAGRVRSATLCAEAAFVEAEVRLTGQPLVAAASLDDYRPPAEFFARCTDPIPTVTTPDGRTFRPALGVSDDRRVWGYAARWEDCHIGYPGVCTSPPREDDFAHYMLGEVVCAAGERVPVGQITMGTGHAPMTAGARAAAEHYDHTGSAVADVVVGADDYGIWISGTVRPGADVATLRAAGAVSGDWRRINGALRLVAVLAVNVPGFQQVRARVASGAQTALVAAGAVEGQEVTEPDLGPVKERIASSMGRDRPSRQRELAARVRAGRS